MSLESKNYVATIADVEAITRAVLSAQNAGSSGRASYLRALIATTQHELGSQPRQRQSSSDRISRDVQAGQISALEKVHGRFYVAVVRAAEATIPAGKHTALELNRRTNFARSAKSMVRSWIRAGNDITSVAASKVTKASLVVDSRRHRAPSPTVLTRQTTRYSDYLTKAATKLAGVDRNAAVEALESAMSKLVAALSHIGVPPSSASHDGHGKGPSARSTRRAAAQHRADA